MSVLPNLLIVDDTEENLIFLETVISSMPVNLIQALSGAEALDITQGMELALAIIDVRMPNMNGYELAVKLNEDRKVDKVPIIFLTANHPDEIEVFKGYGSGAVDYLFKPISPFTLQSKIKVFLEIFNQKQIIVRDAELLRKSADVLTRVNEAIRKAEDKYHSYIDNAPDGVFVADETGKYIEVNEAACRMTGYSSEELLEMSIRDLLTEESMEPGLDSFLEAMRDGNTKVELTVRNKSAESRWWSVEGVKISSIRLLGFVKDITLRKNAEKELNESLVQLHQLTEYIQKVREDERVAISRELHDDLGQALTAVKIDLGIIRQATADTGIVSGINKVIDLVGASIKTVQRLTAQLRPQILDDLGLEAAIEWYTSEFAERSKIKITLDIDPGIHFSTDASLVIFRIIQESLTNIARHSGARKVEISLKKTNKNISLMISDDGQGISDDQIISNKSFGIISMKERAASLGGDFNIAGDPGYGTVIHLNLPLLIS